MTGSLKHIGSTLRSAREAKGLELKDIAEVLKIRRLYLDAIENGDPAELPGLAYFEGYLKNYAKLLGLNELALLDEYQGCKNQPSTLDEENAEDVLSEKALKKHPSHKKRNISILSFPQK